MPFPRAGWERAARLFPADRLRPIAQGRPCPGRDARRLTAIAVRRGSRHAAVSGAPDPLGMVNKHRGRTRRAFARSAAGPGGSGRH